MTLVRIELRQWERNSPLVKQVMVLSGRMVEQGVIFIVTMVRHSLNL